MLPVRVYVAVILQGANCKIKQDKARWWLLAVLGRNLPLLVRFKVIVISYLSIALVCLSLA